MKAKLFRIVLIVSVCSCCTTCGRIDRKAVVARHKIVTATDAPQSPAQVGNGEFAFGVDITGLQTFTAHNTLSHWGWHSFPLPEGLNIADFRGQTWNTHGRDVMYWMDNDGQRKLSEWLAGNPHCFNLGRIGFVLKKKDGSIATLEDLKNTSQEVDMWTGIITSRFELEGSPVTVTTACHATADAIAVKVESPLTAGGQIEVEIAFPYPAHQSNESRLGTYEYPAAHTTQLKAMGDHAAQLERQVDDTNYNVFVRWASQAQLTEAGKPHFFRLKPRSDRLAFTCTFTKENQMPESIDADQCIASSAKGWQAYWKSGAAIDLSGSADPRWKELERRIVLSQYLMKVNEAGTYPPQESGLVNNGWYGRFHFEMIWWHGVHYALWNRWELFDRCLHVYPDYLPTSGKRAQQQGYNGVRWPKCTANCDREWPHPIDALLIWQQPHPIYFAELDYRLHPNRATLDKWKEIVFATAAFMADYAFLDSTTHRYVLGPPVYIVSENTDPKKTVNPAYELSYWRFGLRVAQAWRERLSLPRNAKWDNVLQHLSPLPVEDGAYVTYEGIPDMWNKFAWEHPGLTGVYGMLPGDGVDTAVFARTLEKVFDRWDFNYTWGWDFPMIAMAAARSGQPGKAVDMLLHPAKGFQFDTHGLATGGPFPYFPSNGALLTAVAMMAAGWDGSEGDAPGFPKNGQWVVRHEGFNKMP